MGLGLLAVLGLLAGGVALELPVDLEPLAGEAVPVILVDPAQRAFVALAFEAGLGRGAFVAPALGAVLGRAAFAALALVAGLAPLAGVVALAFLAGLQEQRV